MSTRSSSNGPKRCSPNWTEAGSCTRNMVMDDVKFLESDESKYSNEKRKLVFHAMKKVLAEGWIGVSKGIFFFRVSLIFQSLVLKQSPINQLLIFQFFNFVFSFWHHLLMIIVLVNRNHFTSPFISHICSSLSQFILNRFGCGLQVFNHHLEWS